MRKRTAFASLVIAILATSALLLLIRLPQKSVQDKAAFQSFRIENAERDANEALLKKDYRLLGIHAYSANVPGLDRSEKTQKLISTYGMKVIEGTTDNEVTAKDAELNKAARRYAEKYNKVIISQLPKQLDAATP